MNVVDGTLLRPVHKKKKKTFIIVSSLILQTKKGVLTTTAPPFESLETPFRKFTPWKQLSSYLFSYTENNDSKTFPIG